MHLNMKYQFARFRSYKDFLNLEISLVKNVDNLDTKNIILI